MDDKPCFKCGVCKPLTDFYSHPSTRDGRLGKCKTCTGIDTRRNTVEREARGAPLKRVRKRVPRKPRVRSILHRHHGPVSLQPWQRMVQVLMRGRNHLFR